MYPGLPEALDEGIVLESCGGPIVIEPRRVQVSIYPIHKSQSAHMKGTLRQKYIIEEYMDPLGKVL